MFQVNEGVIASGRSVIAQRVKQNSLIGLLIDYA